MPILELSPIGFYMAYRLLYGTGVISGIGERSDHSTVSVELDSSHVPWDVFFPPLSTCYSVSIRSLPDSIRGLLLIDA